MYTFICAQCFSCGKILWKCFANWMKTYWLCAGNGNGDDDGDGEMTMSTMAKENNVVDVSRCRAAEAPVGMGWESGGGHSHGSFAFRQQNVWCKHCKYMYICAYTKLTHRHTRTEGNLYVSTFTSGICICAKLLEMGLGGNSGYFCELCGAACAVFEYVSFEIVPLQFAWHFCSSLYTHTHRERHNWGTSIWCFWEFDF